MSEVKVNKLSPRSGTTVTIGDSGDTISIPSGVTLSNAGTNTFASATITGDLTVDTTTLKVDSTNNRVGIGTSSPTEVLHVVGDILATGGDFKSDANNYLGFSNDTFARFVVNDTEVFRVLSSGNVGIGTSSPAFTLEVNKGSAGDIARFTDGVNANTVIKTSGSVTTFGPDTSNSLAFQQNNTERMRINSGGQIWMRTSSTSLTNATQVVFHPGSSEYGIRINSTATSGTQYHLSFDRGETQAGYITSNSATTIAFNNASDQRLKENIQNSGSAIQDLKDIQVRQFDWKDEIDTHRDFGFVAQELVNVVPEAVTQGTDELDENGKPVRSWGVDYSHIVPRLVKVCQEQQTKIEELESRITALET